MKRIAMADQEERQIIHSFLEEEKKWPPSENCGAPQAPPSDVESLRPLVTSLLPGNSVEPPTLLFRPNGVGLPAKPFPHVLHSGMLAKERLLTRRFALGTQRRAN